MSRLAFGAGSGSSGGLRGGWRGPFYGSKGRESGIEIARGPCLVTTEPLIGDYRSILLAC